MNMKAISLAFLSAALMGSYIGTHSADVSASDQPIQHLQLPDVTSYEEAKTVFSNTTLELQGKTQLDATELQEIHVITYSLEKALAYLVENTAGDRNAAASKMAELVELVHLASENNRAAETKTNLGEYFKLAESFSMTL